MKVRHHLSTCIVSYFSLLFFLGCAGTAHPGRTGESVTVFHHNDHLVGCDEVGLLARSDGCLKLSQACCAFVQHSPPTRERAIKLVTQAAARLRANAVLILDVAQEDRFITDCEGCCSVTSYRAYGIAFKCPEVQLQWHIKHEEDPNY